MKTSKKPAETPSEPTITTINLVPPPTLEEQLATATKERDALAGRVEVLKQDGAALQEKLAELEKSPLLLVLNSLDAGHCMKEAGERLAELAEECRRLEAKGKFALTLSIAPFKGSCDALVFTPEVKVSAPKPDSAPAIFYSSKEGLSRQDPRQREFGFSSPDRSARVDNAACADEE